MLKDSFVIPQSKLKVDISQQVTWSRYLIQYRHATDILIESIEKGERAFDMIFPLLNLIRHSLEIGLKMNINRFETLSGIEKKYSQLENNQKHNLERLYSIFESHLKWVLENHAISEPVTKEIKSYLRKTNKLKHLLADLDRSAQAFRYPVNNLGDQSFKTLVEINIEEIFQLYFKTGSFLIFTEDVLRDEGLFIDWEEYLNPRDYY